MLIDGGYVVTNAHVVWPFDSARIVFPDGSEFLNIPVHKWDLLADLAVLGPINADASPVELIDGESMIVGTDTFLIGYPGEVESFPQPTITRGLLSRLREWEPMGTTSFQTDAAIAGGQSGGVLVSERGEVIGISGLVFSEAEYGLVASSADILPIIQGLIAGQNTSGLGNRHVPMVGRLHQHNLKLLNFWDERAYVINESAGTLIEIDVTSDNDAAFSIYDLSGTELAYVDNEYSGTESGTATIQYDEPHFLVVWQASEDPGEFFLTSNRGLTSFSDPDKGNEIEVGERVLGNIDYPGDRDYFPIRLKKGETIEVVASSVLVDTFLQVDYPGATDEQIIIDDDGGGGLFGLDSKIIYKAPHTGNYFVVIEDWTLSAPGGYVITIDRAGPGDTLTPTTRATLFDNSDYNASTKTSAFGVSEIRTALESLPDYLVEIDPSEVEIFISEVGLPPYFSDVLVLVSEDTFELIQVYTGELTDYQRAQFNADLSSPGTFIDDFAQGMLQELLENSQLHESGFLHIQDVGDKSIAVFAEMTIEGVQLRMDVIMFMKGNIVVMVAVMHQSDTVPTVSVEEVARLLDAEIYRYVAEG